MVAALSYYLVWFFRFGLHTLNKDGAQIDKRRRFFKTTFYTLFNLHCLLIIKLEDGYIVQHSTMPTIIISYHVYGVPAPVSTHTLTWSLPPIWFNSHSGTDIKYWSKQCVCAALMHDNRLPAKCICSRHAKTF